MHPTRRAFVLPTLLCLLAPARAQQPDVKQAPVPPVTQDVKGVPEPISIESMATGDVEHVVPFAVPPAHSSAQPTVGGFLAGFVRDEVLYDEPGDGRIWAAGDAYKASFGTEGATYVPFFGSAAPKNFPVRFELRSLRAGEVEIAFDALATPVRNGNRIVFDRGPVDEVYELAATSVEQSFVLDGPLAGEVVLEIEVESELARSADTEGIVLAGEHGSVRYSRAFALDARAGKSELATGWDGGAIRIAVPAARTAAAAWPLVVDPVITTFDLDDNEAADSLPDVAYDASSGNCIAVYERVFSATDHDVVYRMYTSSGLGIALGSIDISALYWAGPKVANDNIANRFLCVAAVGEPALSARIVRGRTRDASGGGIGSVFTISGTFGDHFNPDVGGDPSLAAPTYFCVVYERGYSDTDHDIHARMVTAGSMTFGGVISVSTSVGTVDVTPSVSKSNGAPPASLQDWNVVWTRFTDLFASDLYGAQIHWNGALTTPAFAIETGSTSVLNPSASSSTNDTLRSWLVAYQRASGAFDVPDTYGRVYRGSTLVDIANLTALAGAPASERQQSPSADCDGQLFVVADQESVGTPNTYNVFVSTFQLVGNQLTLAEGHKALASSLTSENQVEIMCAASAGGAPRTTVAVWHDQTSTNVGDIEAGLYGASPFAQYCDPGLDAVVFCPCGNPPSSANRGCNNSSNTGGAALVATGGVVPDTVDLTASAMPATALCVFNQGDALLPGGIAFGDGVRCAGGQLLRLATKAASGGSATFPTGVEPSITQRAAALGAPIAPGSKRFYYVYYRDPAAYACAATFNTTNAVQVQW